MEIIHKPVSEVLDTYAESINLEFVNFFNDKIKEQETLINGYASGFSGMQNGMPEADNIRAFVDLQRNFRNDLFKLLENHQSSIQNSGLSKFSEILEISAREWLKTAPRLIKIREPYQKYQFKSLNPIYYPVGFILNFRCSIILAFRKKRNSIRKLFGKKPLDITLYRVRRIPFRNMLKQHICGELFDENMKATNNLLQESIRNILSLWKLDAQLDMSNQQMLKDEIFAIQEINDQQKNIRSLHASQKLLLHQYKALLNEISLKSFLKTDSQFSLVDTLYLPLRNYRQRKTEKIINHTLSAVSSQLMGWDRAYSAMLDDWALDVEITFLYLSVFDEYNQLEVKIDKYIKEDLDVSFKEIELFLSRAKERIEGSDSNKKNVYEMLLLERGSTAGLLADKYIAELIEKLTFCFRSDFKEMTEVTQKLVQSVSGSRKYIKGSRYDVSVSASQVLQISPDELIRFEALPGLEQAFSNTISNVERNLEDARIKLTGLGTVWDYSLESAMLMLDEKKGIAKQAINSALEGCTRSLEILNEAYTIIEETKVTIHSDFHKSVNRFNNDIQKLKNTENLFELNLKIAHIKTVERSRKIKQDLFRLIKDFIPVVVRDIKSGYTSVVKKFKQLKQWIGFAGETKFLAFELSEFINETKDALNKLPFVYQRLYQLAPVDEFRFFVNREKELTQLKKSLNNWRKNRFITVGVIGEKGSGITSLINFFLKINDVKPEIFRTTLNEKIYTREQYLQFFSELFNYEKFNSNEEIIEYLNKRDQPGMIIIENLHHFYLKKVNGFDNLHMLFDLMANTMKKVLWIGAFTHQVWNYLDRTIRISDYFTSVVNLSPMPSQDIEEIISRRNNISGYRLLFKPDAVLLKDKSFIRAEGKVREKMLREHFFKKLNKLCYGNISLAQLYWLRLTESVSDRTIEIGTVKEIDFSFIKNIPASELFVLQNIVLHDGLSLADFATVSGNSLSNARSVLVPMLEKGLLIRPGQKYNINPIIFRPLVNYLQSRNFVG